MLSLLIDAFALGVAFMIGLVFGVLVMVLAMSTSKEAPGPEHDNT